MKPTTRGLKRRPDGHYAGDCPHCQRENAVDVNMHVVTRCEHLRRAWTVAADGRVRAEYHPTKP